MSLADKYNVEKGTVTIDNEEVTLQQAWHLVKEGKLSSEDTPKFPVAGKGYLHADKAHELLCRREGIAPG